jgi:MFS family permease
VQPAHNDGVTGRLFGHRWMPDFRGLPAAFWVLFAGTLVNRIGGFMLVFLAMYLTDVRGLTPAQAGAVVAAYGAGSIFGGPIGGWLADRFGRRPALIAALLGGGATVLSLGFVTGRATLTIAAVATGLLYEMYRPIVAATIADAIPAADRARAYGLIYWAINVGAAVAPLLGGALAARNYRLLFAADAATTAAYGVIVWWALPETRPAAAGASAARPGIGVVLADRVFLAICLLTLGFAIVFCQSFVGLPLDMRAHGLSAAAYGGVIAINGVLIVLLQPWAGELVKHRSRRAVLSTASLLVGAGFGMTAWIETVPWYAVSVAVWTIGEILFAPASMTFVADVAPEHLRGRYQGVFATAFTAGFAAAPALGGYVVGHFGGVWLWSGCFALMLVVAAGFAALRH